MMIPKINAHWSFANVFRAIKHLVNRQPIEPKGDSLFVNHARTGLRMALSALQLPANSKVGVGMYNCYTVMNAIKIAGYIPVFIDVTNDFRLDSRDLTKKKKDISALIVTHLFGIPNNMDEISYICQNIPIIEDCAHAFLSKDSQGRLLGHRGDFAIFSIGQGKFPSIGDGGILQINNKRFEPFVTEDYRQLKKSTLSKEIFALLVSLGKSLLHNPFIYPLIVSIKKRQQTRQLSESTYGHCEGQMARYVLAQYEREQPNFEAYRLKQQEHTRLVLAKLKTVQNISIPTIDTYNNNCFMLPIVCENRDLFISKFAASGVEVAPHFAKSIEWGSLFGYKKGECPNAEQLAKKMVVIPVHYRLKNKYLKSIETIVV